MAAPQIASLAPDFVLESGMQVIVTAISASTGALVSNVSVSNVSMSVDTSAGDTTGDLTLPLPKPPDPFTGAYTMGQPA